MTHDELTEKIAHYICVKQELVFEMTGIAHSDYINEHDEEEFKRLCKKYSDARKEIPEDILEKLDNRERTKYE